MQKSMVSFKNSKINSSNSSYHSMFVFSVGTDTIQRSGWISVKVISYPTVCTCGIIAKFLIVIKKQNQLMKLGWVMVTMISCILKH